MKRSDSSEVLSNTPGRHKKQSFSPGKSGGKSSTPGLPPIVRNRRISRVESLKNLFGRSNVVSSPSLYKTRSSNPDWVKSECQKGELWYRYFRARHIHEPYNALNRISCTVDTKRAFFVFFFFISWT